MPRAFVLINVESGSEDEVLKELKKIEGVEEAYFSYGVYDLIIKVTGEIDPVTGYVMDMKVLKEITDQYVIQRYDHKNLNLDVEDFRNLNPTSENIAITIWKILRDKIDDRYKLSVVLYETERNFVEFSGE